MRSRSTLSKTGGLSAVGNNQKKLSCSGKELGLSAETRLTD